ncbi:double-strand break repair helicase AddA [Nereida sp. MMG025]|uniref:double-strand break repair helicase AddA n=1 Tax=Nereida sp. MMG025 TaxID=2909981 RepID=UPI001F025166|nr:double-strand break repair helicase AddA [Nereida sp. MMG025]MCF6444636.1 double-strand break repair helicase AddA [Nereida sp. MMG025]
MTAPNEATALQIQAARPAVSTWVAANAGSGKTRVLTDRVARLLLKGVAPERILCLTYTKAAASEMQNRLFKRLGAWAMKPDADLQSELRDLGLGADAAGIDLAQARRLFARAIEAPGGLKIQTIHSFCASILRRFPLEAGVAPQFTEIEDRAAKLLQEDILENMASGPHRGLVDGIASYLSDQDFEQVAKAIIGKKALFQPNIDFDRILGLPQNYDETALLAEVFLGQEADILRRLAAHLKTGSPTDNKAAAILGAISTFDLQAIDQLESVFLYGGSASNPYGAKIDRFPTKNCRKAMPPDLWTETENLMLRVEAARNRRLALLTKKRSQALNAFATVFLPEYAKAKDRNGWLDFDDQIEKTRTLLRDPSMAQWVLFRLDGGIDHILVDEAQDTSPEQWDVIESLTQEMTSGEGARDDVERTIFVVGDPKQSIYSFQGADPSGFGRMRSVFEGRLTSIDKPFTDIQLKHSFRSSPAILNVVDEVFATGAEAAMDGAVQHKAFKDRLPGRVDVFELEMKPEDAEKPPWHTPIDRTSPADAKVKLAERIAARIKYLIETGATIPDEKDGAQYMRPVHEGDFLILVRRRKELFAEINRACKEQGLKIAGADRLKIGGETAVADLTALLSFLVTPEDDLSLATVLKSPLFGWTEQMLFTLAHHRGDRVYLWRALQDNEALYAETVSVLRDLRDKADFLRPYDLIERVLTRHGGRTKLIARLGKQAEEGIDALLDQAQSYERTDIPHLTGFLTWLQVEEVEIKRQNDGPKNEIRVMTVHGAKGLEAPIVILPETGKHTGRNTMPVAMNIQDSAVWPPSKSGSPEILLDAKALLDAKDAEESERLLYVALTRAEKWLMIDAVSTKQGDEAGTWYDRVKQAAVTLGGASTMIGAEPVTRYEFGDWGAKAKTIPKQTVTALTAPADLWLRPAAAAERLKTVAPSKLGGAKAIARAGDPVDEDNALRRGRLIHLLLEHLPSVPREHWDSHATFLMTSGEDFAEGAEATILKDHAYKVLEHPDLAFLFTDTALAEVDVTAYLPELDNIRIHGAIDRLIDRPDHVLVVDFKSNEVVPENVSDVPLGLLRQMGAYESALRQIYPDKPVKAALLWTKSATLMEIPDNMMREALQSATLS